jgi:cytochrome c-type biogenesis protein CcmH/NrfG
VSFWRKEIIDFALDQETLQHVAAQRDWIARDPANPIPYRNLAQLYRIQGRQDDALALFLEAVRLDPAYADAHASLAEIYVVRNDVPAAWRHARAAEHAGDPRAVDLLARYRVPES